MKSQLPISDRMKSCVQMSDGRNALPKCSCFHLTHVVCAVFSPRKGRRKQKLRKKRERGRERERERETEKETKTERDIDRERQRHREMEREEETETEREREAELRHVQRARAPGGRRRVSGGSTKGPGRAGGRREPLPGTQAVCRAAARVTSPTGRGRGGRAGALPAQRAATHPRRSPAAGSPRSSAEHRGSSCRQRPAFRGQGTRGLEGPQTKRPFGETTAASLFNREPRGEPH